MLPVPTYADYVPKLIWNNFYQGINFHPSPVNAEEVNQFKIKLLNADIKTYDTYPVFCSEKCDVMDAAMHPYYFDSGHLILTGAARLQPIIEELMGDLMVTHLPQKE